MPTNLNTLKARVRKEVEDNELRSGDQIQDGMCSCPQTLLHISNNGKQSLFLKERFIIAIADMMQKHEEWAERTMQNLRCTECQTYHNPTSPCAIS